MSTNRRRRVCLRCWPTSKDGFAMANGRDSTPRSIVGSTSCFRRPAALAAVTGYRRREHQARAGARGAHEAPTPDGAGAAHRRWTALLQRTDAGRRCCSAPMQNQHAARVPSYHGRRWAIRNVVFTDAQCRRRYRRMIVTRGGCSVHDELSERGPVSAIGGPRLLPGRQVAWGAWNAQEAVQEGAVEWRRRL